jgi:hypothetical protein
MSKPLIRQKTTWLGLTALVSGCGAYFTGDLTAVQAIQSIIIGLIGIFTQDN